MISMSDSITETTSKIRHYKEISLDEIMEAIKACNAKNYENNKEAAENGQWSGWISFISNILSCGLSGIAIPVGMAVVGVGIAALPTGWGVLTVAVGTAMIGGGVLGIASVCLTATDAYKMFSELLFPDDKEKQQLVQWFVPGAIIATEAGLNLFTFAFSFFTLTNQLIQLGKNAGQAIIYISRGGAQAAHAYVKFQENLLDAEKSLIEKELFIQHQEMQKTTSSMKGQEKELDVHSRCRDISKEYNNSIQQILMMRV
jgi:hypothetical protein